MDFEYVLGDLLANVHGALGILFLDEEGECVDVLGAGAIHDIKVIGAYMGIYLTRIRKINEALDLGETQFFSMTFERETLLTMQLPEGYYVVLILGPEASLGLARHLCVEAGRRLVAILF